MAKLTIFLARLGVIAWISIWLASCVRTTELNYFPDQRGPLYCKILSGDFHPIRPQNQLFEPVPLPNLPRAFVLRNAITNQAIIAANQVEILSADAVPIKKRGWRGEEVVGLKVLVQVNLVQDARLLSEVKAYLNAQFAGISSSESVLADVLIQIYSMWLGAEYVRTPCDGIMQGSVPFEMLLNADEAEKFLADKSDDLQLAGLIVYTDAVSGWKLQKSFSVTRSQIKTK